MLLLFFNIQNGTAPIIYVDYGVKPTISLIQDSKLQLIGAMTRASITNTTTTYSSPVVQYSSNKQLYGGVIGGEDLSPLFSSIDSYSPLISVEKTSAVYAGINTPYSSPSVTYSSSNQLYGGVISGASLPPVFDNLDSIKPKIVNIGN